MTRFIAAILAGVTDGATYGLIALGIVLVYKATRVLNFAMAEIGTLAVYLVWMLTSHSVPVLIAVIIALAAAAAMGAGVEIVLRPMAGAPKLTITVATLGMATAIGAAEVVMFGADFHSVPALISGTPFKIALIPFTSGRILALLLTAGLGIGLFMFFKRSLFGLGVLASAQDPTALRLMGLPENRVSMFVWSAGAVLAAIAGIVLAPQLGFAPFFMFQIMIPSLAAALVGGLTSLPGAFVGGIVVGVVENIAKFYFNNSIPGAEFAAVFVVIIAVLMLKPNGLLGAEA